MILKNPEFMWTDFIHNEFSYNIERGQGILLSSPKSTHYGANSVYLQGCKTKMEDLGINERYLTCK